MAVLLSPAHSLAVPLEDKEAVNGKWHKQQSLKAGLQAVSNAVINESKGCHIKNHPPDIYWALPGKQFYEEVYQQARPPSDGQTNTQNRDIFVYLNDSKTESIS